MNRVVFFGVTFLVACGGIRVGEVGPSYPGRLEFVPVPGPQLITLAPSSDAVVNSDPAWAGKTLGEEEWLMVGGAPARGAFWFTYLDFELEPLEEGSEYSSVIFEMPSTLHAPVPLDVHLVRAPWDETEITWHAQPAVAPTPWVRLSRAVDECAGECADVTGLVNEAMANGVGSLSIVIVPAHPWENGALRWNSMESLHEDAVEGQVPTLRLRVGEPPPPLSAAQRDQTRPLAVIEALL